MKTKTMEIFNEVMSIIDYSNFRNDKFTINQVHISKHEIYIFVSFYYDNKCRNYHIRVSNSFERLVISSYFKRTTKHYIKNF